MRLISPYVAPEDRKNAALSVAANRLRKIENLRENEHTFLADKYRHELNVAVEGFIADHPGHGEDFARQLRTAAGMDPDGPSTPKED